MLQPLKTFWRSRRRHLAALTLGLLCSPLSQAALPPDYKLTLLTENFPPFNMAVNGKNFARGDKIQGISAEIVREMFKRAGIDYSLTLRFPWDRIYKQAMTQANHGLFSTSLSEARKPLFKWVGPIGPDDWVLLARGDSSIQLNSLEEAKQYRVGAYKGDAIAEHLEERGLQPITALRDQLNAKKLMEGKIDLWATGDPAGRYLAKQSGISGLKTVLRFDSAQLYLALNKEVPDEVVRKLQGELDRMRDEGFVDAVLDKYL